jgi:excisionase family DNA binding protein
MQASNLSEQWLLTARQAADRLAISERTLWELTNRGDLPCVRLGRSVRYDPADLEAWVQANKSLKGDHHTNS